MTVWNVIRALAGFDAGRPCRTCRENIPAGDAFGMSESICRPCRDADG